MTEVEIAPGRAARTPDGKGNGDGGGKPFVVRRSACHADAVRLSRG